MPSWSDLSPNYGNKALLVGKLDSAGKWLWTKAAVSRSAGTSSGAESIVIGPGDTAYFFRVLSLYDDVWTSHQSFYKRQRSIGLVACWALVASRPLVS